MILRGIQIHRIGHGRCGLFPNPTLSSNKAQLPFSCVPPNTRTNLFERSLFSSSKREGYSPSFDHRDQKPFHVTRARNRAAHHLRA